MTSSFESLDDYARAVAEGLRRLPARVTIGGVRWRPHGGHSLVEFEFDQRIGYNVPVREVRHERCIADDRGRTYCPHCRSLLPPTLKA